MDDLTSPAAARPTPNTPSVVAHASSQAVVASPPLPVVMDPHLNGIIDNIYPRQIQYEQRHPPQFYSHATTPRIVTQPDLDDNEAAALLSMLRATAPSRQPSSPLLNRRNGNDVSILHDHLSDLSGDLWDASSTASSDESSCASLYDGTTSIAVTPFNEICLKRKRIITSAISQIFHIDTPRDWQIEAIHHVLFRRAPLTIVSRRTADGKSLVPLCVGAVKRGVVVVLVPLLGLGSDQVEKSIVADHKIE
jgi:hypothetical protein